jgi:aminodeoxyfutalosine deaminase
MSLESYLRAAPKAELHVHLEGTVQPETLFILAKRNGVALPFDTVDGLRKWFKFRDFTHFIEAYALTSHSLVTADDYELIAWEYARELALQNCRYVEIGFTPAFHARKGISRDVWFGGLTRARSRARRELGVEIAWNFDIGRRMGGTDTETQRWAEYTVDVAIESMADGLVALGLAGPEEGNPPEWFTRHFDRARAAGLHSYPHAGEHAGPESVRGAIEQLGAERIAHGVRAIEDQALLEEVAERGIGFDVCPTSNVCLSVAPSLAEHQLPKLLAAGIKISIASDDPPMFNTTLNDDVALLADPFELDIQTVDEILLNGFRNSFLSRERKRILEATYGAELDTLKPIHLA